MGTACSTEKYRISPTASTGEFLCSDHPLIVSAKLMIENIELIGEIECAPTIVRTHSKKLLEQCNVLKGAIEKLETENENFLKIWNLIENYLRNIVLILKVALKEPEFIEFLPIISFNLQEQQKDLEVILCSKKGTQQQIKRAQSNIIQTKVIRINKRHQTDKI